MDTPELKRTVRRAAGGDEEAAGTLFDEYHPRVYAYALAKLRKPADAEDVASETFARVLRDLDKFRWRGAGFEAWLFRIAANLVVDHTRVGARETPSEEAPEDRIATAELDPADRVVSDESAREIKGLLGELAPEQREVLLLRFAGGLDTNEAGRVLGKKANAVRQLQFRALENLREMMREEVEAR